MARSVSFPVLVCILYMDKMDKIQNDHFLTHLACVLVMFFLHSKCLFSECTLFRLQHMWWDVSCHKKSLHWSWHLNDLKFHVLFYFLNWISWQFRLLLTKWGTCQRLQYFELFRKKISFYLDKDQYASKNSILQILTRTSMGMISKWSFKLWVFSWVIQLVTDDKFFVSA